MNEQQLPYERHLFVCINEKQGEQCCGPSGGLDVLLKLREYVNTRGLVGRFNITKTRCLGHCQEGPTLVIYPDGIMLTRVNVSDVPAIIARFLS